MGRTEQIVQFPHHFLLPSKASPFSIYSHSLTLSPPHIIPQFPPPLSAPQTWKNSLDSLTAALSVWNYAIKKTLHNCEKTEKLAAFCLFLFFRCCFPLRIKNSQVEVYIIREVHDNDNNDSSARCRLWDGYRTSDLGMAQPPSTWVKTEKRELKLKELMQNRVSNALHFDSTWPLKEIPSWCLC